MIVVLVIDKDRLLGIDQTLFRGKKLVGSERYARAKPWLLETHPLMERVIAGGHCPTSMACSRSRAIV